MLHSDKNGNSALYGQPGYPDKSRSDRRAAASLLNPNISSDFSLQQSIDSQNKDAGRKYAPGRQGDPDKLDNYITRIIAENDLLKSQNVSLF